MSTNYNKIILAGNITRDIQLTYTPANTPVADFGLAINKRWKGKDGEQREETCFIDCRAFARTAEVINQYFSKGKPILVEGELNFSTWEKDGQKRSKHRVTVHKFEFLGDGEAKADPQPQAQAALVPQKAFSLEDDVIPNPDDMDIPF